jgi:hypothetical protein
MMFQRGFRVCPIAQLDRDPYKVLGVDKSATTQQIKEAYFNLAKKYHPDANKTDKEAPAKFSEIREAYEVSRRKSLTIDNDSNENDIVVISSLLMMNDGRLMIKWDLWEQIPMVKPITLVPSR